MQENLICQMSPSYYIGEMGIQALFCTSMHGSTECRDQDSATTSSPAVVMHL